MIISANLAQYRARQLVESLFDANAPVSGKYRVASDRRPLCEWL